MIAVAKNYVGIFSWLEKAVCPWLMPTLARFVFIAVFFYYFWNSAGTKLENIFTPTSGAFAQIFPKAAEAVLWDLQQITLLQKAVLLVAAWAEYALPALLLVGLATRLAALGMIGFVLVQSYVDVVGHGAKFGAWFDNVASGNILDERTLWFFLFVFMVFRGAGPLSADAIIRGRRRMPLTF